MLFERERPESATTMVKLQGNPLNHVISLQSRLYERTHRRISKGNAIAMLLNKIPKEVVEKAIKAIVEERQKKSP